MKKLIALVLCALMLVASAACVKGMSPDLEQTILEDVRSNLSEILPDGWQVAEDFEVTDEMRALFDKVFSGVLDDASHIPVACLGSFVDNGTSYCFLERLSIMPYAKTVYRLTFLHENPDGTVEMRKVTDLPFGQTEGGSSGTKEDTNGCWAFTEDFTLTDELRELFDKGVRRQDGVVEVPIAYLGYLWSQPETEYELPGGYHGFLAMIDPDDPVYVFEFLAEDHQGNIEHAHTENLPVVLNDDGTMTTPPKTALPGGWTYAESYEITEELADLLNRAVKKQDGIMYNPVAILGTQIVSGTNYCLLCQVTPVSPDPEPHYAYVYVHETPEGETEIRNVTDLVPMDLWNIPPWKNTAEWTLTDELRAIFEKGLDKNADATFIPIAYLGNRIIEDQFYGEMPGEYYCLLTQITNYPIYALEYYWISPEDGYVYAMPWIIDPVLSDGSTVPLTDADIQHGSFPTGWEYTQSYEITDELVDLLNRATKDLSGEHYAAIAQIATQTLAGTNHLLVCQVTPDSSDPEPHYALVLLSETAEGEARLLTAIWIDHEANWNSFRDF